MNFKLIAYQPVFNRFNYVYLNTNHKCYYIEGQGNMQLYDLTSFTGKKLYKPSLYEQHQLYCKDLVDFINKAYKISWVTL